MRHHETHPQTRPSRARSRSTPTFGAAIQSVGRLLARWSTPRRSKRSVRELDAVRRLCEELLHDVPGAGQRIMLLRLERVQDAKEVVHLRSALFDVVSRCHGEGVARERILTLDRWFR